MPLKVFKGCKGRLLRGTYIPIVDTEKNLRLDFLWGCLFYKFWPYSEMDENWIGGNTTMPSTMAKFMVCRFLIHGENAQNDQISKLSQSGHSGPRRLLLYNAN